MKREKREILLEAFTKEDFTDIRIMSFREQRNDYTFNEYREFLNSITIENELSKRIINFLVYFQKGCLCPTKCDAYEPLKESFNPNDITKPVKWLSQPGSAFNFKRDLSHFKCDGVIENHRFASIWQDKKATMLLKPIVSEPKLLGKIQIRFDKRDLFKYKKENQFVEEILHEIDKIIKISEYKIEEP